MKDAQVQAVGAFVPVPAMARDGTMNMSIASPVDFGAEPVAPPAAPPQLGSDTQAVLRDLGVQEQRAHATA